MHLDYEATLAMLVDLKEGDQPVQPGDSITVGDDTLVCSKVYGWKDGFTFSDTLTPTRFLQVSWFKNGAKRAEKMNLHPQLVPDEGGKT